MPGGQLAGIEVEFVARCQFAVKIPLDEWSSSLNTDHWMWFWDELTQINELLEF